jgi:hypothetical protein
MTRIRTPAILESQYITIPQYPQFGGKDPPTASYRDHNVETRQIAESKGKPIRNEYNQSIPTAAVSQMTSRWLICDPALVVEKAKERVVLRLL